MKSIYDGIFAPAIKDIILLENLRHKLTGP